jgi:hypothetical protein
MRLQHAPTPAPTGYNAATPIQDPRSPEKTSTTRNRASFDGDAIRQRAYGISQRPDAGSPAENWDRAAAEVRDERGRRETPSEAQQS